MKIAVLITCHNRRDKTIECLRAFFNNSLPKEFIFHVVLVDDGSNDGTTEAVNKLFPNVEIINGNGDLYWNKGMHVAFNRAIEIGFDGYIWLNDDTILYPNAIKKIINIWIDNNNSDHLYIGSTQNIDGGQVTYGGLVRNNKLKPFNFTLVIPNEKLNECHTMNGNCVFIPQSVVEKLGNLEPRFAHSMGDIDYGLRAFNAGMKLFVVPGFIGECSRNSDKNTFNDRSLPLITRLKKIMHPKGLPPRSWLILTSRHGGFFWPIYWIWPYFKLMLKL